MLYQRSYFRAHFYQFWIVFIFGACSVYEFDPVSDVFRQYNMFYAFYRLGCGVCINIVLDGASLLKHYLLP